MPADKFVAQLNAQIGREFAASQQYVAAAVYYDGDTLPRLASFFYEQAKEERVHAMMMIRYLLDTNVRPVIPGIDAPKTSFKNFIEPIQVALAQEQEVGRQISDLVGVARKEKDYLSEQFVQWFLKEQIEEVALMQSLLDVAKRAGDQPLFIEEYLARETVRGAEDPTAPDAAGEA
ncbi:MAG: ferritin [Actinomycetota bacterium]